jgi:hypothetical protein
MKPIVLLFSFVSFLIIACQPSPPQTGHREIAAAVRTLLDKSYAGIDYPTYQAALKEVEAISAARLERTPHDLQARVDQMLEYLRTAEEILRWQSQHQRESEHQTNDPVVRAWTERYPFLQAAVGARTQSEFDVPTALTLLWDKTDEVLRGLQIKSAPL